MVNWNEYLNKAISCKCGRKHQCNIKHVDIGTNVIAKIADYIKEEKFEDGRIIYSSKQMTVDMVEKVMKKLRQRI